MSAMVILPKEGDVAVGGFVTFKLAGHLTDGSLAVIEHQVAPGTLAAPPHTHQHEHEISYILEGTITVQLGDLNDILQNYMSWLRHPTRPTSIGSSRWLSTMA